MHRHLLLALSLLPLAGCAQIFGAISDTTKKAKAVNMDNWQVLKMSVDVRAEDKRICPGQPVQMIATADLKHVKRDKTKTATTSEGERQQVNKLAFDLFEFTSDQGSFNEHGVFAPNPDVLATAVSGFALHTKYLREPDKYSFTNEYRPSYDCITQAGAFGPSGQPGMSGSTGDSGSSGSGGSSSEAGGNGGQGGQGGNGTDGGPGGPGLNLTAYATVVKTPHYDHLVMVKLTGDVQDVLLFDPKKSLQLSAAGGAGGSGGSGGSGGRGGSGGSGYPGGNGGAGGAGGNGGNGGAGGPGGQLTLIYDDKFPELATVILLDASGGPGGFAGPNGSGGDGGSYGNGNGEGAPDGAAGAQGPGGTAGQSGPAGPDGVATAQAGNVDELFADLPEGIERV
ncbi:MAG: hypothetical protein AAGF11_11305 [Myxococcota bacterium]